MSNTRYVRIDSFTVGLVEESKEKTGVAIGKFFEQAAIKKLEEEKIIQMPVKKKKKK